MFPPSHMYLLVTSKYSFLGFRCFCKRQGLCRSHARYPLLISVLDPSKWHCGREPLSFFRLAMLPKGRVQGRSGQQEGFRPPFCFSLFLSVSHFSLARPLTLSLSHISCLFCPLSLFPASSWSVFGAARSSSLGQRRQTCQNLSSALTPFLLASQNLGGGSVGKARNPSLPRFGPLSSAAGHFTH